MSLHHLAGKPAPHEMLIDVKALVDAYYSLHPDPGTAAHRVSFGTSGHRGSSLQGSFNEDHILAITQAICDLPESTGYRRASVHGQGHPRPFRACLRTALEVLAANGVTVMIQEGGGYTPTPVISHAILSYNRGRKTALADGIVVTPSHNPPEDGGFKYNPPEGGPADTNVTALDRKKGQRAPGRRQCAREAHPLREGHPGTDHREYDYAGPIWKTWATSSTWRPSRHAGLHRRRRPGRGRRGLLADIAGDTA